MKEYCGCFGIYAPELEISKLVFYGLVSLQHRGQESFGIVTFDKQKQIHSHKAQGLVTHSFDEEIAQKLSGGIGVGHVRYSTAGGSSLNNSQPFMVETSDGVMALCQNGQLARHKSLRENLLKSGVGLFIDSDVEVMSQLIASIPPQPTTDQQKKTNNWESRLQYFMEQCEGAYALVTATSDAVYACRDYLGFRPLCIGKIMIGDTERFVISSESCAFHTVGAEFVRDILPGEIVRIDEHGLSSFIGRKPAPPAFCVFEYVYFARPDTVLEGQLVHKVRQRLGTRLAIEAPIPKGTNSNDFCVMGVPDSSLPAAIGYAKELDIPYIEGLIKNRYIHRTFIQPTQHLRNLGVSLKFNPLTENIKGKKLVLIDDSIVRANSLQNLIPLLKKAGAKEIHVRVSSPPIRFPCYMGIDIPTKEELVANQKSVKEIEKLIDVDSLNYLSYEGMVEAIQESVEGESGYCGACFSGDYPLQLDW